MIRWALLVTYTIIQSIMRSEMCSLHLTHPSVHTWSSGQPTVQRPGSSRGLPAVAGIRTHNLGLPQGSSPTLYPLGHDCPKSQQTSFSSTLFSSTQLSVNMLGYSTLWTASLAMNVCVLPSLWRVSMIVFWTTVRSVCCMFAVYTYLQRRSHGAGKAGNCLGPRILGGPPTADHLNNRKCHY